MTSTHELVKGTDFYPIPPWYGFCRWCDTPEGAPVGWVGNTEQEIEEWFYEHTIS